MPGCHVSQLPSVSAAAEGIFFFSPSAYVGLNRRPVRFWLWSWCWGGKLLLIRRGPRARPCGPPHTCALAVARGGGCFCGETVWLPLSSVAAEQPASRPVRHRYRSGFILQWYLLSPATKNKPADCSAEVSHDHAARLLHATLASRLGLRGSATRVKCGRAREGLP